MWYDRKTDQCTKIEPHLNCQLILWQRCQINPYGERTVFSLMLLGQLDNYNGKTMNLYPYFPTNMGLWIIDLNVKIKLLALRRKHRWIFCNLGLGKNFLERTQKTLTIKKMINWIPKLKNFSSAKYSTKNMHRKTPD